MSARNTGTPAADSCSARPCSVLVLPVPVAPATSPCRLTIGNGIRTLALGSQVSPVTRAPSSSAGPVNAYPARTVAAISLSVMKATLAQVSGPGTPAPVLRRAGSAASGQRSRDDFDTLRCTRSAPSTKERAMGDKPPLLVKHDPTSAHSEEIVLGLILFAIVCFILMRFVFPAIWPPGSSGKPWRTRHTTTRSIGADLAVVDRAVAVLL